MVASSNALFMRYGMMCRHPGGAAAGSRRATWQPAAPRHYKLLLVSPSGDNGLHQALLSIRTDAADGPLGDLVLDAGPDGNVLRLVGPLLRRRTGCQLLLAEEAGGPTVLSLAVTQPLERRTTGRLDGLLTVAGWPEPATVLAGRCLLRRLSPDDHARLTVAGAVGRIATDRPGAQRTLALLRRRQDGPHVHLG